MTTRAGAPARSAGKRSSVKRKWPKKSTCFHLDVLPRPKPSTGTLQQVTTQKPPFRRPGREGPGIEQLHLSICNHTRIVQEQPGKTHLPQDSGTFTATPRAPKHPVVDHISWSMACSIEAAKNHPDGNRRRSRRESVLQMLQKTASVVDGL